MRLAVRGVLFDLDGTLLDTSGPIGRSWTRWAGEHQVSAADFVRVGSHGRRSVDLVAALVPPDRAVPALARIRALELADVEGIVAIPGAVRLLRALPADAWGIVTSGDRSLATARLRASELAFAVDRLLVTGDEVHAGKPDPAPYAAGAAALGFDVGDCLVVEDAPAGIASGVAAGARTLALTTTVAHDELTAADVVVDDLARVSVLSVAEVLSVGTGIVLDIDGTPVADPVPSPRSRGARP